MPHSPEFMEFYSRWRDKARDCGGDLQGSFDRFFTLYVLFNRLYVEAARRLCLRGRLNLEHRHRFPDAEAAQEYVVQYVGATHLLRELKRIPAMEAALDSIRSQVGGTSFWFKLDILTGDPQPDQDRSLRQRLAARSPNTQLTAVLETLYAVRCNMFHGRKGFEPIQQALLVPLNTVLERIVEILYDKLAMDNV